MLLKGEWMDWLMGVFLDPDGERAFVWREVRR
jgi:hypothetical protein